MGGDHGCICERVRFVRRTRQYAATPPPHSPCRFLLQSPPQFWSAAQSSFCSASDKTRALKTPILPSEKGLPGPIAASARARTRRRSVMHVEAGSLVRMAAEQFGSRIALSAGPSTFTFSELRQLHSCAAAPVVALQAQGKATQGRELSSLASLRALRSRTPVSAWARRAVGEAVRSCPRAGCGRSACPVR
jgi:hypothetical protein